VTCVGASLSEAREAKAQLAVLLADWPTVNGIGVGRLPDGWVVQVNLSEPLPDDHGLPDAMAGVPVRYDTIGPITKR
jgi:hypothetical protein